MVVVMELERWTGGDGGCTPKGLPHVVHEYDLCFFFEMGKSQPLHPNDAYGLYLII
jgi:hypothetical protein